MQTSTPFLVVTAVEVPKVRLNDGKMTPQVVLGTYIGFDENGIMKSQNKEFRNLVLKAIVIGYRNFDCASIYGTEEELGEAINIKIADGTVTRKDIFVTTKLWNTHHSRQQVMVAVRESLNRLALNYIDLYLMHWPIGINDDHTFNDVDFMETWRGMEDSHDFDLVKSIGVSNFNKEQLQRVLDEGRIRPSVLEIEVHPQIIQKDLIAYAQSENITVMAYSALGSLVSRGGVTSSVPRMDDPKLLEIARKYNKTTPQVVLRWHVDRKVVPITKTMRESRLIENINIFDFQLTKEEIEEINQFNTNTRYTYPTFWQTHPHYPFEKVDNPMQNPFI